MGLSRAQDFMLFLLGMCYNSCSQKVKDPLQLEMRKCDFIVLARKAGLIKKSERAMYKNFELLEKSRYLNYKSNRLSLTKKGQNHFNRTLIRVGPYVDLATALKSKDVLKFARRAQLRFKNL